MLEESLQGSTQGITNRKVVLQNHYAMQALVGPNNINLNAIEDQIPVRMRLCGNELWIHGQAQHVESALCALREAYSWACEGRNVDVADLVGLVKISLGGQEKKTNSAFWVGKRPVSARTKTQLALVQSLQSNTLSFALGPAGTGKTYIAVAYGIRLLLERKVKKMVLSRPAVEAGERIGFLPGDMKEKVDPYMRPLYDVLYDFIEDAKLQRMLADGMIEVAPLAFMRGRTLSQSFVVLDEAQNATKIQMKMFLTRLGEGSHMAVTGDPHQTDLPSLEDSGLLDAQKRLKNIEGVGCTIFSKNDVVRHGLVSRIIDAYEG